MPWTILAPPQLRCCSKTDAGDLPAGRFGQRLPERLGAFDAAFSKAPIKNERWRSLSLTLRSGLPRRGWIPKTSLPRTLTSGPADMIGCLTRSRGIAPQARDSAQSKVKYNINKGAAG